MVCDHAQGIVAQVIGAGLACRRLDQAREQVDFVITVHMLQHRSQTLQPHAGIDTRFRQRR